jgi:signal transduction histidine kinase
MFSRFADQLRRTAAWRLSGLTAVAFGVGTGVALLAAFLVVEHGIRERGDGWLIGECDLLAEVYSQTPPGAQQAKLVEEVAELAAHEVLPAGDASSARPAPVFFLVLSRDGKGDIWAGPHDRELFVAAVRGRQRADAALFAIDVPGWPSAFRVARNPGAEGGEVFLGFIDEYAEAMLGRVRRTFLWLWGGMLLFGFAVSFVSIRRVLGRVERVSETAARVGREERGQRVPIVPGQDEIARLGATFNEMLDRIEKSVEQIRAVTDAVAHDLRNPVTAIRGDLELALTTGEPGALRESAGSAIDGLDRLLETVETTLDVAEAEAGALRLQCQRLNLQAMAREMVEIYAPAAEEHGITLNAVGVEPVEAWLDANLLRRALRNLLDNALQHLAPGSHVEVRCTAGGGRAIVAVADDGPGFPPEIRARAFGRFVKGRDSQGFGLGLSLVQATARAHGGEAWIEDREGGGSVISLGFPVDRQIAR